MQLKLKLTHAERMLKSIAVSCYAFRSLSRSLPGNSALAFTHLLTYLFRPNCLLVPLKNTRKDKKTKHITSNRTIQQKWQTWLIENFTRPSLIELLTHDPEGDPMTYAN